MGLVSLLGLGSFLVASFAVGLRLLRRAFRTLQVPEFAAGSAFFLSGGVGYALIVLGRIVLEREPPLALVFYAAGLLALDLGVACLGLFVWQVFRPGQWLGAAIFGLILTGLIVTYLGTALATHFLAVRDFGGWEWYGSGVRLLCFAWTGAESLRLRSQLLRHGDPHSLRLGARVGGWAIAAFCAGGLVGILMVRRFLGNLDLQDPVNALATAALGITSAVAVWKAFGDDEDLDVGRQAERPLASGPGGAA